MVSFIFKFYAAAILVVGYLISVVYSPEYADWYNLGSNGLPVNLLGYATDKFMQKLSVDKRDITVFSPESKSANGWIERVGPAGNHTYLSGAWALTSREPAETYPYVVPQMEVEGNTWLAPVLKAFLKNLAAVDPDRLTIAPSNLDGDQKESLWLKKKKKWQMVGEFAHVHNEASSHFLLSVPDARAVIENGWGERHGMSGRMLPLTYMFVYSPRNDVEIREWRKIADASVAFMTAD